MLLLKHYKIDTKGMHAIVVGRSNIVGRPMSILLSSNANPGNCTVTICHSRTADLPAVAATGDILVAAIGRPGFVRKAFVKAGATVIDVGINRVTDQATAKDLLGAKRFDGFLKRGSAVVGDVHPEVSEVAGAVTPVPGGVGPLTVAMLMANTLRAAELRLK